MSVQTLGTRLTDGNVIGGSYQKLARDIKKLPVTLIVDGSQHKHSLRVSREVIKKLNISKANMSNLLSFADLPHDIIELFPDISKVSSRTATEVRAIYNKGGENLEALKRVLPSLPVTAGANRLSHLIMVELNGKQVQSLSKKIYGKNNELLFTVRSDGEKIVGLSFPLSIISKINEENLCSQIKDYLETVV